MQHDVKRSIDAFKMALVEFDIIVYLIQYICCTTIYRLLRLNCCLFLKALKRYLRLNHMIGIIWLVWIPSVWSETIRASLLFEYHFWSWYYWWFSSHILCYILFKLQKRVDRGITRILNRLINIWRMSCMIHYKYRRYGQFLIKAIKYSSGFLWHANDNIRDLYFFRKILPNWVDKMFDKILLWNTFL